MDRREFLLGSLAALGVAGAVRAQQSGKVPRIGVLLMQPVNHSFADSFRSGLKDLGYVEGRTIETFFRSAGGDVGRLPALAAELVKLKVDVIVAGGGTIGVKAAQQATTSIPIVFAAATDPVAAGFVKSLARPGGNVTGLSLLEMDSIGKRL